MSTKRGHKCVQQLCSPRVHNGNVPYEHQQENGKQIVAYPYSARLSNKKECSTEWHRNTVSAERNLRNTLNGKNPTGKSTDGMFPIMRNSRTAKQIRKARQTISGNLGPGWGRGAPGNFPCRWKCPLFGLGCWFNKRIHFPRFKLYTEYESILFMFKDVHLTLVDIQVKA